MVLVVLFWILVILALIGAIAGATGHGPPWLAPANSLLNFVLIVILGLAVFGNPANR